MVSVFVRFSLLSKWPHTDWTGKPGRRFVLEYSIVDTASLEARGEGSTLRGGKIAVFLPDFVETIWRSTGRQEISEDGLEKILFSYAKDCVERMIWNGTLGGNCEIELNSESDHRFPDPVKIENPYETLFEFPVPPDNTGEGAKFS